MFEHPIVKNILTAVLVIIAAGFIGQVVKSLLNIIFKRLFASTKTTLDDRILSIVRSRIITLSIIAGFFIGIKIARQGIAIDEVAYHQILDYVSVALYIVLVFVVTKSVSRLVGTTFEWYMDEVSEKTHSNITATVAPMMKKIVDIILFLIAGMIVLDHFGVNIGSLLVSLGVGSLAVALAAQETVANMIAGFVILIDQPFRVGDRIKLPSGEEGDVTQIGLRSTRILNYDNNLVVIPNSDLVKNRIINFSFPNNIIRVLVEVSVAYRIDIERAKKILLDLAINNSDISKEPAPRVFVMDFGKAGLLLRLSGRTSHFDKKFEIETTLREQVYKSFTDAGIEISLPRRIIYSKRSDEIQAPQKK
ncbi:MAG: mechanosensitive ion channel family protein [Ignavibacteriales bacterium]|nr:mechanosensitive ion channel family protein [Ignavibacteriales bacterium]